MPQINIEYSQIVLLNCYLPAILQLLDNETAEDQQTKDRMIEDRLALEALRDNLVEMLNGAPDGIGEEIEDEEVFEVELEETE
jgi:hypothetical protein